VPQPFDGPLVRSDHVVARQQSLRDHNLAVVLRLLPLQNPEQLVQFTYTFPKTGPDNWNSWFDYPQFERFREQSKTLSGIFGGTSIGRVNIRFHETSLLAHGDAYTDNFFSVLGVTPQSGRLFSAGEDRADASVAILSDRFWRSQFAADPSIVGGTVTINQIPFIVIGITSQEFSGIALGSGTDVWVPLHALDRFSRVGDLFEPVLRKPQRLEPAIQNLEKLVQPGVR
jgi:hypothetical protein